MSNIIAVIWDFDKTLIQGYMQDPIFRKFNVDPEAFWRLVNSLPDRYQAEQGVTVNRDTFYLNYFIECAHAKEATPDIPFPMYGLNNAQLREFGRELTYFPGATGIFDLTREVVKKDMFAEFDIRVEHYIVSTGMKAIIEGSAIRDKVEHIWACELLEKVDDEGRRIISAPGYTIDNTTKTRALFEIEKGVPKRQGVDVNMKLPEELKRVQFENMIYIADGPSDVPAFSVINVKGGSTFGIYPRGNMAALAQLEKLRSDGRIQMYAEANYERDSTAAMWLCHKISERAHAICDRALHDFRKNSFVPKHILPTSGEEG